MKIFILLLLCPLLSAGDSIPARVGKKFNDPKVGLVTFALHNKDKLVKIDKQRLLDIHNALRKYAATGKETHSYDGHGGFTSLPTAADMQAMSWDDNLATYAQNWADKCQGSKHSSLKNDPLLNDYAKGFLAESLSGDITAQERDMYGEVQWWNYETFSCKSGENCGHYLAFNNAMYNHLGCGYKQCRINGMATYTVVCVYGGNIATATEDGATRLPWQHEYTKGAPCSKCQQGWDYCMGGGLCATKQQCESDPKNDCKCLHSESECHSNGGTFDGDACTCSCPANKMGINCAEPCANTRNDCGSECPSDLTAGDAYLCQKACGSCGKAKSAAYKWTYVSRNAPNSEGIVTRCKLEDNDEVAKKRTPQGKKYCQNKASNASCEILKERRYCHDFMVGMIVRDRCKLSCNQVCKKPDTKLSESDLSGIMKSMGMGGISTAGGHAKGTDAATALAGMSGLGDLMAGVDLSGFKVVRRRRRRR